MVVSALAVLKQCPQFQSQADVLALIQQEYAWAQQVEEGFVAISEDDLERLKISYFRIEEALARPVAPALRASPPSQPTATDVSLGEEPSLFIRASDDIELLNEFCNEGRELLEQIEQGLLVLEDEPQHKEMLNQVFRAFHTFKGGAGLLELTPVKLLAHELESLLSAARNGHLQINPRVIDLILGGADLMRSFVDLIGQRLAGVNPDKPVQIPINALIARVSACLNGEDEPVANEPDPAPTPQTPPPTANKTPSTPSAQTENLISFVKLDTRKLDQLVDLVGELVIAQSLVVQNPQVQSLSSLGLAAQLRQLARITTDLQQTAMSLRMVPMRGIFQKMSRLVRDLSMSQNKLVRLQLLGEDTEIDRNMIEELADPLMHMIRNGVDHGIELPQVRLDNGKPAEGTIKLEASHRDGGIAITISDDGRGMDPIRIKTKAIEKQLISANDILNTTEIFDLIFQPGFSTAESITEVSGRGVGMDVVRGHIAKLRGRVEVQSTLGEGSQFTIRLPLTLAIIDGMLLNVGEERFILPTLSIRESFKPLPGMISKVQGRGEVVSVRGKLIPLVRLHEQLEIASHISEPVDGIVVVVQSRSQMRGILVDGLIGKSEVVIKPLGETFKHAFGMTGCAILGDGRVALILDPDTLGTLQRTPHRNAALSTVAFH